jgi:Tfp pilus assembly protein PilF
VVNICETRAVSMLCLFIAAISLVVRNAPAREDGAGSFEIRGTLIAPPDVTFALERAYVQLGNPVGPPITGTQADGNGRFRIKRVPAGMYFVSAYVPRLARTRRTVDVSPSLADAKGVIEITLQMERSPRRVNSYQVAVDQLSIPEEARSEFEKGLRRFGRGDLAEAASCFQRSVDVAPNFGAAWHQLGTIEYFRGNYKESAVHFEEAEKYLPGNYQVLIHLGAALLAIRDGSAAVGINARAVRERPNDPQGQAQLGFSLFLVQRFDEAEIHLKKAVELDPANYFFPQLQLAEIYRLRRDYLSMARELEQFVRLHPDAPSARQVQPVLKELRTRLASDH